MENQLTGREQIVEVANKLFVYTDNRQWQHLMDEVFTEFVLFDMASLGAGNPVKLSARQICETWQKGFEGIDAVHHQAGNYLVSISNDEAAVKAYAIAIHFKKSAVKGQTREFVGSYNLGFSFLPGKGWRIHTFRYYLKFTSGNLDFK